MSGHHCLEEMAREWYGYGRWEAPYWFIGPEPGNPEGENLQERCAAWSKLGRGELLDCKDHHVGFGWCDWHRESPPPPTQPTWRQLIRLTLAVSNGTEPTLEEIRRDQQRHWGRRRDEEPNKDQTCVIELCSLAAKGLKVKKNVKFDPTLFIEDRIEKIRARIRTYKPAFVVMYGKKDWSSWEVIAGGHFLASPISARSEMAPLKLFSRIIPSGSALVRITGCTLPGSCEHGAPSSLRDNVFQK